MKISVSPISRCSRVKRLRICAWIETSSAETGSSAMISSAPMASARAMPTRWHWPPESWRAAPAGEFRRQADPLHQLGALARQLAAAGTGGARESTSPSVSPTVSRGLSEA